MKSGKPGCLESTELIWHGEAARSQPTLSDTEGARNMGDAHIGIG